MNKYLASIQNKLGVKPDGYFGPVTAKSMMHYLQLTPEEAAHLIGQCRHETGNFTSLRENLSYSARQIMKIFQKYFDNIQHAEQYQFQPEKLGNRVYANRYGNGSVESGDGFKYRGGGMIHLTFYDNYKRFSEYMNVPEISQNPELVVEEYAMETSIFYFEKNNLFDHCKTVDKDSIVKVSKGVNVGNVYSNATPNHLDDRIRSVELVYNWLK